MILETYRRKVCLAKFSMGSVPGWLTPRQKGRGERAQQPGCRERKGERPGRETDPTLVTTMLWLLTEHSAAQLFVGGSADEYSTPTILLTHEAFGGDILDQRQKTKL